MSKHTPEPWTKYTHHELPSRMIVMNINDYQRATHCVNILAGLEYPGQYLSDLQSEIARLREALEAIANAVAPSNDKEAWMWISTARLESNTALKGGPHEAV